MPKPPAGRAGRQRCAAGARAATAGGSAQRLANIQPHQAIAKSILDFIKVRMRKAQVFIGTLFQIPAQLKYPSRTDMQKVHSLISKIEISGAILNSANGPTSVAGRRSPIGTKPPTPFRPQAMHFAHVVFRTCGRCFAAPAFSVFWCSGVLANNLSFDFNMLIRTQPSLHAEHEPLPCSAISWPLNREIADISRSVPLPPEHGQITRPKDPTFPSDRREWDACFVRMTSCGVRQNARSV
jgi:hypothetical protein